jgi:hypothetical protein
MAPGQLPLLSALLPFGHIAANDRFPPVSALRGVPDGTTSEMGGRNTRQRFLCKSVAIIDRGDGRCPGVAYVPIRAGA